MLVSPCTVSRLLLLGHSQRIILSCRLYYYYRPSPLRAFLSPPTHSVAYVFVNVGLFNEQSSCSASNLCAIKLKFDLSE